MTEEKIAKFYSEIGALIRKFRESKKMKPEILAEHLSLTRASVINIEKGRHKPAIHTLVEISVLLEVHFTELIPEISPNISTLRTEDIVNIISDDEVLNHGTEQALKKFISSINQVAKKKNS
jgi:transcriptional regulator with XRE-family HTH domain